MKHLILLILLTLSASPRAQDFSRQAHSNSTQNCEAKLTVTLKSDNQHSYQLSNVLPNGEINTYIDDAWCRNRIELLPFQSDGSTQILSIYLLVGDVPYKKVLKDTYTLTSKNKGRSCLSRFHLDKEVGANSRAYVTGMAEIVGYSDFN